MIEINRITSADQWYYILHRLYKKRISTAKIKELVVSAMGRIDPSSREWLYVNPNQTLNLNKATSLLYHGLYTTNYFNSLAGLIGETLDTNAGNLSEFVSNLQILTEDPSLKGKQMSLEGLTIGFKPSVTFKLEPVLNDFNPDWGIGEVHGTESFIKTTNEWGGDVKLYMINHKMEELVNTYFAVPYNNSTVDVFELRFRLMNDIGDVEYFNNCVCQVVNEATGESGPVIPMPNAEWFGGILGKNKAYPQEVITLSSFPEGYRRIDLLPGHTWVIKFWKDNSPQKNFTIKQTSNITGVKTSVSVSGDNKTIGDGSTVFKYRAYPDVLMVSRVTHVDETLNWNNASSATLEVRHPSNNSLISSHSVYSANMPIRITIPNNLSGVTFNYIIHKKDTVGIPFKIHIGAKNVNTSKNCYIAVNTFLTDQADSMRTNIAEHIYSTQQSDSWLYNYNGNVPLMKDNPYKKLILGLFETSYTNPGSIEILATINGYAHPKVVFVWDSINIQEFHFNLTKDIYYDGRVNDVRIELNHMG